MANRSTAVQRDYERAGYPSNAELDRIARIRLSIGQKGRRYQKLGDNALENYRIALYGERAVAFFLEIPYKPTAHYAAGANLRMPNNAGIDVKTTRPKQGRTPAIMVPASHAARLRGGVAAIVLCVWVAGKRDADPVGWATPAEVLAVEPVKLSLELPPTHVLPLDRLARMVDLPTLVRPSQPMLAGFEAGRDWTG